MVADLKGPAVSTVLHSGSNEYEILLIVSDLHLSEGWDKETKRLSRNEDFFFDTSFQRFLHRYSKGAKVRLIVLGDFVDFLQVTSRPEGNEVDEDITDQEKEFGLGTSAKKTCWKLRKIMNGHWIFFQTLAKFLAKENEVIIIPGNHDIEFTMSEVQECLRREMETLVARVPSVNDAAQLVKRKLQFRRWFYYEKGFIYAEHGHQYDSLNSFDYFLYPYIQDKKLLIDLPAGSFFVRYLLNKLESTYPFADNMKPITRFARWAVWKWHMWLQIRVFLSFFGQIRKKARHHCPQWEEEREREQERLLQKEVETPEMLEYLRQIKNHWEKSALHHLSKGRLFLRFIESESCMDPYYKAAKAICKILGVPYVVFGHTHEADIRPIKGSAAQKAEYINSGTWTKVFTANYEERLLKEENEFAFVRIDKKQKSKVELLRWRDDLGQGERVRLFQPVKK